MKENQILSEKLFDLRARKHNLTPIPKKEKLGEGSINISMITKKDQKIMQLGVLNSNENSKFFENTFTNESPKETPHTKQRKNTGIDRITEI